MLKTLFFLLGCIELCIPPYVNILIILEGYLYKYPIYLSILRALRFIFGAMFLLQDQGCHSLPVIIK